MRNRLSFLFFLAEIATLLSYLAFVNNGLNINIVFFWAPIIAMSATFLYQFMNPEISKNEKLMLLEIFLFTFTLHLIIARPGSTGIVGHDPHYEYSAAKTVMDSGWPIPRDLPITIRTRDYSEWPMLHFFALNVSKIVGIDLFTIAKWLPSLINSFSVLFLYLFSRTIYGNKQVAFIASLAFSGLFPYINFQSRFVRESFAFIIFLACLYVFVKAQKTKRITFYSIMIFLVISLVFSHHFTSFVLLLFMFTAALVSQIVPRIFATREFMKKEILSPSYRLILILLLLNVSYWFFLGEFGLRAFFLMISGLYFRGIESFSARRFSLLTGSPRMVLASYGNLFFLIILGLFVLSYLLKNRKRTNISYIFFMFFGGVLISMSYLSLFIESLSRIDFTRFATFGYPFILISGAYAISKNKHKRTMAILISGFILLQVFTIPSYLYDVTACPEYRFGGYREYYLPQEYSAVGWSSLLGKVAGDWSSFELFGGLGQMQVIYESDKVAKVFEGNIPLLSSYDWFIFRREDFNSARVGTSKPVVVTVETYSKFNHAVFLGRVYDNGEVEIYRSSPEFDGFP